MELEIEVDINPLGLLSLDGEVPPLWEEKPRLECTEVLSKALVFELQEAGQADMEISGFCAEIREPDECAW